MSQHSTTNVSDCIPNNGAGKSVTNSASSQGNSAYTQITAGEAGNVDLTGLVANISQLQQFEVDVAIGGAGSEVVVCTFRGGKNAASGWQWALPLPIPLTIAASTRIAVRMRMNGTTQTVHAFKILVLRQ